MRAPPLTARAFLAAEVRSVEDQRRRALPALPRSAALAAPAEIPPLAALDVDANELAVRALAHNQELRAAGVETEAAGIGVSLARWEYAPMFTLGGGWMVNDEFGSESGEREDSSVVTLGLTLPLWAGAPVVLGGRLAPGTSAEDAVRAASAPAGAGAAQVRSGPARADTVESCG